MAKEGARKAACMVSRQNCHNSQYLSSTAAKDAIGKIKDILG